MKSMQVGMNMRALHKALNLFRLFLHQKAFEIQ